MNDNAVITFTNANGHSAELRLDPDGRLSFVGTLPPSEAAQIFIDSLSGFLLDMLSKSKSRVHETEAHADDYLPLSRRHYDMDGSDVDHTPHQPA